MRRKVGNSGFLWAVEGRGMGEDGYNGWPSKPEGLPTANCQVAGKMEMMPASAGCLLPSACCLLPTV